MNSNTGGSYYGPDGIAEYVMYAFNSAYMRSYVTRVDISFKTYDENIDTCVFHMNFYTDNKSNSINANPAEFCYAGMLNVTFDYSREIVSEESL